MIKKILVSIGVLLSFFLMFLLGFDKIIILAYSDIGNALGSYPIKLDYQNYDTYNLYDNVSSNFNLNRDCFVSLSINNNYGITATSNSSSQYIYCGFIVDYLENGKTYSLSTNIVNNTTSNNEYKIAVFPYENNSLGLELSLCEGYNKGSNSCKMTFYSSYSRYLVLMYPNRAGNITPGESVQFNNIMIYEGTENKNFAPFFKFGYNVNYSLSVNNLTPNQVNAGIAIVDSNGNYLKTGNCIVPGGSSTICNNLNDSLYLPFNIDNNGYISFEYSLGLTLGPVGYLSVTPNDSGFNFVPVFNAYYNGSPTNNLYFKDRYTFNNLFLSGFNVSVNSSTLSKVVFGRNQIDSSFSMNTNNVINFATDKKIETGIYNYINYIDFITSSPSDVYSFVITSGVSDPGIFNDRLYTISFSNFSLRVNGDASNTTPLPNNPSTLNKYNECSAWYDIPCQLGNAVTYVIYEAPIISPVLTFIVSFITMFSSLVAFVDLFRSFGIIFGCFIIYMFINLLHKYSK